MNPTPATTTGTTATTQPGPDTVTLNASNPFTGAVAVKEGP